MPTLGSGPEIKRNTKLRVVIQGAMGAGKTTVARILANHPREAGVNVTLDDPGSSVPPNTHFDSEAFNGGFYDEVEITTEHMGELLPNSGD